MVRSRVLPPLTFQCAGILVVLKTLPSLTDILQEGDRQSEMPHQSSKSSAAMVRSWSDR